jgi:DNA-binding beta-propeller fold protein YncE
VSVAVDPSGRFAYVVNIGSDNIPGSNNISAFTINTQTGTLTAAGNFSGTAPSSIVITVELN